MSGDQYYTFRMFALSLCDEQRRPRGDWRWHRWRYLEQRLFGEVVKSMEKTQLMTMAKTTSRLEAMDEKQVTGALDLYQLQWLEDNKQLDGPVYSVDALEQLELLGTMRYQCAGGRLHLPECEKDHWAPLLMRRVFDREFDAVKITMPFKFRGSLIDPVESYDLLMGNPTGRDMVWKRMEQVVESSDPSKKQSGEGDGGIRSVRYDDIRADYTMEQWLTDYQPYYAPCQLMAFRRAGQRHLLFAERQFIGHAAKHGMNRGEGLFFLSALFNKSAAVDLVHYGPSYDKERKLVFNEYRSSFAKVEQVFGSGCKRAVELQLCPFVNPALTGEQLGNLMTLYVTRDTAMFGTHINTLKQLQKTSRNWKHDRHKAMCHQMVMSVGSMIGGGMDAMDRKLALTPNAFADHLRECSREKNKRAKTEKEELVVDDDVFII
jgi:hypothetical protein